MKNFIILTIATLNISSFAGEGGGAGVVTGTSKTVKESIYRGGEGGGTGITPNIEAILKKGIEDFNVSDKKIKIVLTNKNEFILEKSKKSILIKANQNTKSEIANYFYENTDLSNDSVDKIESLGGGGDVDNAIIIESKD